MKKILFTVAVCFLSIKAYAQVPVNLCQNVTTAGVTTCQPISSTNPISGAVYSNATTGYVLTSNGSGAATFQAAGGGGGGTVTSVSVATANGFSGTVTNATTTPAITIIAGAISLTSATGLPLTTGVTGVLPQANGGTNSSVGDAYNLYGMPLVQSGNLHSYGDSNTDCSQVTSTTCYPYYLSQLMAATETNNSLGGDMACDMVLKSYYDENPGPLNTYTTSNPIYTDMIGTNDANIKGTGAYEVNYNNCVVSAMLWQGIPSNYKANGSAWSTTGSWTTGNAPGGNGQVPQAIFSNTNGSTATGTITTYGGPLYFVYAVDDTWTGTFTYSVDGGAASSTINSFPVTAIATQNSDTTGFVYIRLTGLSAVSHTLAVMVTSTTGGQHFVEPVMLATPGPLAQWGGPQVYNAGVLKQQNDAKSATTAQYDADAKADVALLASDGVQAYFVPTRNYTINATDYANTLHINATGHQHVTEGLSGAMQVTPFASGVGFPLNLSGADASNTGFSITNTTTTGYEGVRYISNGNTYWSAVGNGSVSVTNLRNSWFVYDQTSGYTSILVNASGNVGLGYTAQYVGCNPGTSYNAEVCGSLGVTGTTSFLTTDDLLLPVGTTGQRPGSPAAGMLRYNSTLTGVEAYYGSAWNTLSSGNQTITLSGDTTGSGTTAITTSTTKVNGDANVAFLDVAQSFTKAQRATPATDAISTATFTPDFSASNNHNITLVHASCPCTLANPTSVVAGQAGVIVINQSATGSDLINTYGTNYVFTNAAAPTLSTGANAVDEFSYYVVDSTHIRISPLISTPAMNTTTNGVISNGTKFTTSGCSVSATTGGATAGKYTSGTTGACTVTITMNGATGLTAPAGWACSANDITTAADALQGQTGSSTTTATISGTTVSGDVVSFFCMGY